MEEILELPLFNFQQRLTKVQGVIIILTSSFTKNDLFFIITSFPSFMNWKRKEEAALWVKWFYDNDEEEDYKTQIWV